MQAGHPWVFRPDTINMAIPRQVFRPDGTDMAIHRQVFRLDGTNMAISPTGFFVRIRAS